MNQPADIPFNEAISAKTERMVEAVGIMGFSQGGGATHDLIERIFNEQDIITRIGVYLDAVRNDGLSAETDWPDIAFHTLNIYEDAVEFPSFGGGDIDDDEVFPGATLEEYDVSTDPNFNNGLDHFSIDDDPDVQTLIKQRLSDLLINR